MSILKDRKKSLQIYIYIKTDITTDHITPCSRMRARGKNLPGVGVGEWWGNGGGKATAVMPHGGGKGHWSMDNSPTPPQVGGGGGGGGGRGGGGGGLIIDRCIS